MPTASSLLLPALRRLPRRYLLPPLPADAQAARAAGPQAALAFAIDAARAAHEDGGAAPAGLQALFTEALAATLAAALDPAGGDPAYQALVLRSGDARVQEHVLLVAQAGADRRAVRSAVDAIAHPGKLRGLADSARREALARLHRLGSEEAWPALRAAAGEMRADPALRDALDPLLAQPALARLERAQALAALPEVRRHDALCAAQGPAAGSDAAAAQGRASARAGADAEMRTVEAFQALAAALHAGDQSGHSRYRVVRGLRLPRGFPGTGGGKAKEEWDVALLHDEGDGAEPLLLAEVKASPAAASSDLARLLRGLRRLSLADPAAAYAFPAAEGPVRLRGAALRALQPEGFQLPEHVIYCCTAPPETRPPLLAAASQAVLLAEAESLAWAREWVTGERPAHEHLAAVWRALPTAARLRATLYQYTTAQAARGAMLHPADLRAALAPGT